MLRAMIEGKRKYKAQMIRAQRLPEDYRFVFKKVQHYIWQFATGDAKEMLNMQYELIQLFESAAAEGKHVLEVIGEDVSHFCDELLADIPTWQDKFRKKLNRDVTGG